MERPQDIAIKGVAVVANTRISLKTERSTVRQDIYMTKIAKVFATKTKMCPDDKDSYFDAPDLFTPVYEEVHISVTFTWAMQRVPYLKREWGRVCSNIKIGGPALGDPGGDFISGKYLKEGVTITSRGCPNNCSFCFVPKREGKIRELKICPGNVIQDNNLLACSKTHIDKVFGMLKKQKKIDFSGGFEASRVTTGIVEQLRGLNIYQIWLAYDHPNAEKPLKEATEKLSKYFSREKIRCYVLIGYKGDTLEKAENRLVRAWELGTKPFAMRYRTGSSQWGETYLHNERAWNLFQREWTRPAIIYSKMKTKTNIR